VKAPIDVFAANPASGERNRFQAGDRNDAILGLCDKFLAYLLKNVMVFKKIFHISVIASGMNEISVEIKGSDGKMSTQKEFRIDLTDMFLNRHSIPPKHQIGFLILNLEL
jgi:hypothetical protein